MSVGIITFVTVKAGEDYAFVAEARRCVTASRAEPGVLRYELWREAAGDRRFVFNALYSDNAAVQAHMASDQFKAFGLAARHLVVSRPEIIVTQVVDVAE